MILVDFSESAGKVRNAVEFSAWRVIFGRAAGLHSQDPT
jgi:hypothetical protein